MLDFISSIAHTTQFLSELRNQHNGFSKRCATGIIFEFINYYYDFF